MVARGPGVVGCAHCHQPGAAAPCVSCGRTVCAACAGRWTTCEQPIGRVIRLGEGRSLEDVDPSGRLGLVSRWYGRARIFDLRHLRWVNPPALPERPWLKQAGGAPVFTRRHLVSHYYDSSIGTRVWLVFTPLAGGEPRTVEGGRFRALGVCRAGEHVWSIRTDEKLQILGEAPGSRLEVYENPLPLGVVQSASIDTTRRLVALGTWGMLGLFEMEAGALRMLARFQVGDGDVRWVSFGGSRLAAIVERSGSMLVGGRPELHVWELAPDLVGSPARPSLRAPLREQGAVSLSADGRTLALSHPGNRVVVHDLDAGRATELDGHVHPACLVRFTDGDRLLVTADFNGDVALRPRAGDGYAAELVRAKVPAESIDLAESLGYGAQRAPDALSARPIDSR